MTAGAIGRAILQSNHYHQQTNTKSFLQTGCPSCRPTNSVKALKGKISHSVDLLTPSSPGSLPTLSLTTNSSWLPWGRVAVPLISPLLPVAPTQHKYVSTKILSTGRNQVNYICGIIQQQVHETKVQDVSDLRQCLIDVWAAVAQSITDDAIT